MREKKVESESVKNKVIGQGGREGFAPQVEIQMIGEIIYLGSFFSKNGGPQKDVKMRAEGGLKTFGAIKIIVDVRNVILGMRREL